MMASSNVLSISMCPSGSCLAADKRRRIAAKMTLRNTLPALLLFAGLHFYSQSNRLLNHTTASAGNQEHHESICTTEYINSKQVAQDDPCVISIIQRQYLHSPAPRDLPYHMSESTNNDGDPSDGQSAVILKVLRNKTKGFFIECGAVDGEYLSNTLYMERYLNWTGILIEPNPNNFARLLSRNRKSWKLPVCLSPEPYPTQVSFVLSGDDPYDAAHSYISNTTWDVRPLLDSISNTSKAVTVQCFPLYSILLAIGQTEIDYFSLDVEGFELRVLKTLPWDKVTIKTMTVEWLNIPEGADGLANYVENLENQYTTLASLEYPFTVDLVFALDVLREPNWPSRPLTFKRGPWLDAKVEIE